MIVSSILLILFEYSKELSKKNFIFGVNFEVKFDAIFFCISLDLLLSSLIKSLFSKTEFVVTNIFAFLRSGLNITSTIDNA